MEFQNSFNHYPNTMINLCAISYNDLSTIITDVSAYDPNLEVVWGPAQLTTNWPFDQSYSRAFIARNVVTDEYTLVIRGTNPLSFTSWAEEDFDIIRMRGLDEIARGLPTDITVSSGTFNGINFLLQLLDNGPDGKRTGLTLLEFLLQKQPRMLFITGHSLGGTLTPAMYVVLHQLMRNANKLPRVYFPFSFAGLTPGGDDFNNYLSY